MPSGAKKRKAARKKLKKLETHDSTNQHRYSNSSSSLSHGSDNPKPVDERDSGKCELESVKEEACREKGIVDQHEAERMKGEVVRVEVDAKSQEDGLVCADYNSVNATSNGVGIGVSVEELQKSVEGISDNGLVKEVATLAQEVSPAGERLVISDVVSLELMKNADTFSPILDDKKLLPTVGEGELGKIETQAVSVDEGKSLGAPTSAAPHVVGSVENGNSREHKYDNPGVTVAKTCCGADCCKNDLKLETQKQSEQQALIGVNRPLVRRTSWMGCCGLFEVFTGADR